MNIKEQIKDYISSQPEPKRSDIDTLHNRLLQLLPKSKLWFLDGKDAKGKIVTNPQIGYGLQTIKYADGRTKVFFKSASVQTRQEYPFISWALKTKSICLTLTVKQ
jgi:hypothetical protein